MPITAFASVTEGSPPTGSRTALDAPVLPVLNFMNLLDDDERQSVRERAEQILNERFGELVGPIRNVLGKPYFEINAKAVLNHLTRGGKNTGGDFELLKSVLFDLAGPYRLALQSRVRSHRLQAAIAPLRDQNRDALRPLRESARNETAGRIPSPRLASRNPSIRREFGSLVDRSEGFGGQDTR